MVLAGTTGGKKVLIKTDGSGGSIPKYYTGQSAEQSVTFKFDLEPPYHCSEDDSCCSGFRKLRREDRRGQLHTYCYTAGHYKR